MSRLILHIGTHKTATTAIQHALFENRHKLLQRGVWYPTYELIGHCPHYAHLGMVNALAGAHQTFTAKEAEEFFNVVVKRAHDFDATLISAEPFYRHIASEKGPTSLTHDEYWKSRQEYIKRLGTMFGDAEITVVFRRQADYAESLYQEHIKVTQYSRGFKRFLKQFWFHFDYFNQVKAWGKTFKTLHALRFDDLICGGDPAKALFEKLGINANGLIPATHRNASMALDAVIVKRILNTNVTVTKKQLRALEKFFEQLPDDLMNKNLRRCFFSKSAELKAFQANYDDDNERLKSLFMPNHPSELPLFEPINPDGRAYGDQLDPSVLKVIIELAIKTDQQNNN